MKQGQILFLFHEDKPLAVDVEKIITLIGVTPDRTAILLVNGRDITVHKSYGEMMDLLNLRQEAEEAGQLGAQVELPVPGPGTEEETVPT